MRTLRVAAAACALWFAAAPRAGSAEPIQHTLPNGMRLLLLVDRGAPLVSEALWVGAGSVDETGPTSGLSHLLEHLLFDGTTARTREEITREFERRGVYVNAFTRREYTAHLLTAPREEFLAALEIQAEMLLRPSFPESELEKERKVVLEEMTRDRDDAAGHSQELFEGELFAGTSLARPVIGTAGAIAAVTREAVAEFHRRHYVADRMTAIVIGDFDPAAVRDAFQRLYGGALPALAPREEDPAAPAAAAPPRYVEESLDVASPILRLAYPAPDWRDPLAPALELALELLAGSPEAPLVRRLTQGDSAAADDFDGYLALYGRGGACVFSATLDRLESRNTVETALREAIERLARKGPDPAALERARHARRVAEAFESENPLYYAMGLCEWVARGGWEGKRRFDGAVRAASAREVRDAAAKFLAPGPGLVHLTRPFTREAGSGAGIAGDGAPPRIEKRVLPNGLVILARENPGAAITSVHVLVGRRSELTPPELAGLGNFTLEMLPAGTTKRDRGGIAAELARMGARLQTTDDPRIPFDDYYWSPDHAYVRAEMLTEHALEGLALLAELLREPSFPQSEISAARERLLGTLAEEGRSARAVATQLLREGLLEDSPLAQPIRGTPATLGRVDAAALREFHRRAFAPDNLVVSIAGGLAAERAMETVAALLGGLEPQHGAPPPRPIAPAAPAGGRRLARDLDRDQSHLALGRLVPGLADADAPALVALAAVLDRRLGLDLRETRGLAYSVGAGVTFTRDTGWFSLGMGTRAANVPEAAAALEEHLGRLRSAPVTSDELALAVTATNAQRVRYRQRNIGQAYYAALYEYLGRGPGWMEGEAAALRALTPEELQRVAIERLPPGGWVSVEVGRGAEERTASAR